MTNPRDFDDLARLLRRARSRDERKQAEEVGDLFADLFQRQKETSIARVTGNTEHGRAMRADAERSERHRARHSELEERRLFGEELTEAEARELADLRERRDPNRHAYYRPAGGAE